MGYEARRVKVWTRALLLVGITMVIAGLLLAASVILYV